MDAREVERRIADGEHARQALLPCASAQAGRIAAQEAAHGRFKRRRPSGVAAMTRDVALRGTGAVGPAITRADGVRWARA
jgi:hypothetical protein